MKAFPEPQIRMELALGILAFIVTMVLANELAWFVGKVLASPEPNHHSFDQE